MTSSSLPNPVQTTFWTKPKLKDATLVMEEDNANGTNDDDIIFGNIGDNTISTNEGNNQVIAGRGNDIVNGGNGMDTLFGGKGDDILNGNGGDDFLSGGKGDDRLYGGGGHDIISAGKGDDLVEAGNGNDRIHMGAGNDTVQGEGGDDCIAGGEDNGTLLLTKSGWVVTSMGDELFGNGGADKFEYTSGDGVDFLFDFNGQDGDRLNFFEITIDQITPVVMQTPYGPAAGFGIDEDGDGEFEGAVLIQGLQTTQEAQNLLEQGFVLFGGVPCTEIEDLDNKDDGDDDDNDDPTDDDEDSCSDDVSPLPHAISFVKYELANGVTVKIEGYGNEIKDPTQPQQYIDFIEQNFGSEVVGYIIKAGNGYYDENGTLIKDGTDPSWNQANVTYQHAGVDPNKGADWQGQECSDDEVVVNGTNGNNTYSGGKGNSNMQSFDGNDVMYGGNGDDTMNGGRGNDRMMGEDGDDIMAGSTGHDQMFGGRGHDYMEGQGGDDLLRGHSGNDYLSGGSGSDLVEGNKGNDVMFGGSGEDVMYGHVGQDIIFGGDGEDKMFGGKWADKMYGDYGADLMYGGHSNDMLRGGAHNDKLFGDEGNDRLHGESGNDTLGGGAGRDQLFGGSGNDKLYGNSGNDRLDGSHGDDILFGGAGADRFIFKKNQGDDIVMDFNSGEDELRLDSSMFHAGTTLTNIVNHHITQDGDDLVITTDYGQTITLEDTSSIDVGDLAWL